MPQSSIRLPRPCAVLLLLAPVVAAAAGCGRAVSIELPPVSPEAALRCAELFGQLPDTVADQRRLGITDDGDRVAGWGAPAVVWRCGGSPPAVGPTAQLLRVGSVDWAPTPLSDGVRFVTVGRYPVVEVTVPAGAASNPAGVLTQVPVGVSAPSD